MQRLAEVDAQFSQLDRAYRSSVEAYIDETSRSILEQKPISTILSVNDMGIINAFGKRVQQVIYRHILLQSITELWMEHLTRMEALRVSIRMEAYAQRDPLVQYKSFSTDAFKELLENIRLSVVGKMFRLQPARPRVADADGSNQEISNQKQPQGQQKKKKGRKRHKK